MTQTDLIIIGAGPGGYRAAERAAKGGLKVVVFEQQHVGGTCLNVGCIPTKTYVHSRTFEEARERQQQVVAQLRQGVETILAHPDITLVHGHAVFVDAHTVTSAACGDIVASNIIVATGSSPRLLSVPGADSTRVVDSTGLLQMDILPKRLCIIGAGVVGMEFASVFRRFGSEVTVIEYLKECLPMLDSDIARRLRKLLEKRGITFRMKTAVQTLDDIYADVILMATGRKPNVQADFSNAGFEWDERSGISVDAHFQTTQPGIYAIGDVNTRQMLAHAAEWQAGVAVKHILDNLERPDNMDTPEYPGHLETRDIPIPSAVFTEPEAACVGPGEDQLKAAAMPYECRKAFYRANGRALAMGQTEGMLKLFCEPGAGRILGCHVYGAHAADLVQEASVLMSMGATVAQLRQMVHIHPTLGELLSEAANI